jgi:hypothetical protein
VVVAAMNAHVAGAGPLAVVRSPSACTRWRRTREGFRHGRALCHKRTFAAHGHAFRQARRPRRRPCAAATTAACAFEVGNPGIARASDFLPYKLSRMARSKVLYSLQGQRYLFFCVLGVVAMCCFVAQV